MPVRCLVSVPYINAKSTFTIAQGSLACLTEVIAACPVLGGLVNPSSVKFQDTALETEHNVLDDPGIGTEPRIGAEASQKPVSFDLLPVPDEDGKAFELPRFGGRHDVIMSDKPLTSSVQRKIVDLLFHAMLKYTVVPTRQFYSRVMHLLLQKYPQLIDVVGTGSDSWKMALRYKFKNQRRLLSEDARVAENKKKFGSQRKTQDIATAELQRHKKPKLDINHTVILGEDEISLVAHEEWLLNEAQKGDPDEAAIRDRITLTANSRLSSIAGMKIEDVKKLYPYMMQSERFIEDFKRLSRSDVADYVCRGIDAMVRLGKENAIKCSEPIQQLLQETSKMNPVRRRTRHLLAIAVMRIIALNVKEPKAL